MATMKQMTNKFLGCVLLQFTKCEKCWVQESRVVTRSHYRSRVVAKDAKSLR